MTNGETNRNRLLWGLALVVIGVFLLLDNLGVLTERVWSIIWPIGVILAGVWLLGRGLLQRGKQPPSPPQPPS